MAFVWANPLPSRWSPPPVHQSDNTSQSSDDESDYIGPREPWFKTQFTDQSILIADEFRLVYVTQNEDVLGISEPFNVTTN